MVLSSSTYPHKPIVQNKTAARTLQFVADFIVEDFGRAGPLKDSIPHSVRSVGSEPFSNGPSAIRETLCIFVQILVPSCLVSCRMTKKRIPPVFEVIKNSLQNLFRNDGHPQQHLTNIVMIS